MRSCYHNLPSFGDVDQMYGFRFHSDDVRYEEDNNRLTMELKNAYPEESALIRFVRTGELASGEVRITDDIELGDRKKITFHFMVMDKPTIAERGVIRLSAGRNLHYANLELEATVEEIQIDDLAIRKNWGRESIYRILLSTDQVQKDTFKFTIK